MTGGLRGLLVLGLLLGLSAVFAGVILDRRAPVLPPIGAGTRSADTETGVGLPALVPAGIEDLVAALEHPLFIRSRTPPAVVVETGAEPAPSRVEAKLAGVLTTGTEKVAIVFPTGSQRAVQLHEGDLFQGWRVVEIGDDSLVLERDGRMETLILDFAGEAPAQKSEPPARK